MKIKKVAMRHTEPPLGSTAKTIKKDRMSVHFNGSDYSSALPPVDRDRGSDTHQRHLIEALLEVKDRFDELTARAAEEESGSKKGLVSMLRDVIDFLKRMDSALQMECALAVSLDFCEIRIAKIARRYIDDFKGMENRWLNVSVETTQRPLRHEECLTGVLDRAIRYQLRMLLNCAPAIITKENEKYEDLIPDFSGVSEIVFAYYSINPEVLLEEYNFAAMVSETLLNLCIFAGPGLFIEERPEVFFPDSFCSIPSCQITFKVSRKDKRATIELSERELDDVLREINSSCVFLAAARSCSFLVNLLDAPGVQDEISRVGGWELTEKYATIILDNKMYELAPDCQHLVALHDVSKLVQRLNKLLPQFTDRELRCMKSIDQMKDRFRVKTKTEKVLARFPQIPKIAKCLEDGLSLVDSIPIVRPKIL